MKKMELIAPCHFGLEAVLKREILDLGYEISEVEDGRVTFYGDADAICRANIFLRTAERILLKVGSFRAVTFEELFDKTKVGRPLIQKLVGASVTEKANNLIFITTSDFSNEAIEYANATHVQLINGENLIKLSERVYHSDNKNYFDEDSVRLDIQDFLEYIPKDILAICYDNM